MQKVYDNFGIVFAYRLLSISLAIILRNFVLTVIIARMNPYFSRSGDDGYSGILGEGRVPKYHPRLEAVGTVDEASAALGLARSVCRLPRIAELILVIQRDLYHLMAEVAALPENASRFRVIREEKVSWLEQQINDLSESVELPREFTVSGSTQAGASLDLARTIVRRAERRIADLLHQGELENIELLRYINRLSSLCYILEGAENMAGGENQYTLAKE
jgi:cob(I)alamin adenosyltransferase